MVQYNIYKICCDDCDYVYVGSTKNFLRRKQQHKQNSNNNEKSKYKLYKTINEYDGWDNWRMITVEECDESIQTRRQAEQKEEEWRLKLNASLNSQKCFLSKEDKIEYNKKNCSEWGINHKDYVKEQRKEYREANAEKVKELKALDYQKHKEKRQETNTNYRIENRDKINEQKKQHYYQNKEEQLQKMAVYREENKEKISERKKLKVKCSCGAIFRKDDNCRHIKSDIHKKWVKANPDCKVILENTEGEVIKKAVIQYDLEMNKLAEFESSCHAEKELNIKNCNIRKCCSGNQKTTGGYTFRYI